MAELGKIPEGGEEIEYAGVKIKVTDVYKHSVKRVQLILPPSGS
jgi:CBS domain containing-hemolysin-like protein